MDAVGLQQRLDGANLAHLPANLDRHRVLADVRNLAPEDVAQVDELPAHLSGAHHLDEHQLALHEGRSRDVLGGYHVRNLQELTEQLGYVHVTAEPVSTWVQEILEARPLQIPRLVTKL